MYNNINEVGDFMNKRNKKNLVVALAALTSGTIGAAAIASHVAIYDKMFPRYERPDYSLTPGLICYDRLKNLIEREEIFYPSDDVFLIGHHYRSKKPKGLVVIAHGLHAGADDYLSFTRYFINHNFDVFAFNYQGTYESQGEGTVGMCQSLVDLDNTLAYIQKNPRFKDLPIFLFGHSWGAYAVCSVLSIKKGIKAVASIAPMNDGYTMSLEKASQYVGKLSNTSKPFLDVYQKYLFREYTKYNGVKGINDSNIPILIAHGIDDKVITFNGQSIISHYNEITNKNVEYYIGKGLHGDHTEILYSLNAINYRRMVKSDIKLLEMKKQEALTDDELREYYKTVNHDLYHEINEDLMERIIKLFEATL